MCESPCWLGSLCGAFPYTLFKLFHGVFHGFLVVGLVDWAGMVVSVGLVELLVNSVNTRVSQAFGLALETGKHLPSGCQL
jgi:hypothetical protein